MTGELARDLPSRIRFVNYHNGYHDEDRFLREIRQLCRSEIRSLIEGRHDHPER